MKTTRKIVFTLFILAAAAPSAKSDSQASANLPNAQDILKKSVRAIRGNNEEATYRMRLMAGSREEGVRTMNLWFKSKTEDDAKLVIKFSEPANIRGTGLLTLHEVGKPLDQWLFLPAYKKTRRIKGGNESESFLGSDFTMADISVKPATNMDFTTQKKEKCGDLECFVIIGKPKADLDPQSQPYTREVVYVRTDNLLNIKTEFYSKQEDGSEKLEKVMSMQGIKKDGDVWTVEKIEMKNLLTDHTTFIELVKRDLKKIPADSVFTQGFLEKGV